MIKHVAAWLAAATMAGSAAAEPLRQDASGMVFPDSVGKFRRVSARWYDDKGENVSAGYNLFTLRGGIIVTVYVYPALDGKRVACAEYYAGAKSDIMKSHRSGRLVSEGAAPLRPGVPLAKRARFAYEDSFARKTQPVISDLLFYCPMDGRWIVKYRVTWAAYDKGAEAAFEQFRQGLNWTIGRKP